ncbi:MAG: beta-ketoacyl-ACP synthase II [Planctomycetota bacterium]|nr:beta-ketoacyl-ACP synthase II [Planctomycetota bacterium]
MTRRVVVTGLGTVNACGNDVDTSWNALLAGESGIGRITRFNAELLEMPCLIAGELKGWNATDWVQKRDIKKLDLCAQYGIAAATQAWADAGLGENGFDPERFGAILGTGIGGLDSIEETHTTIMEKGPQRVSAFFVPKMMANAIAGQLSIRFGLQGPSFITASACASSNHAMALALRSIRSGECDALITGGAEATITSMGMAGFNAMRAMSRRNDDPAGASRPFDKNRDGFVMGEGAGILLFEELEHAKQRGARIYCEVLGAGMSSDSHHITAPAPGGIGPQRSMRLALKDGGLDPSTIDYINAHGTSTALNDVAETEAVKAVFGDHARELCMSSSKSMVGHLLGASGGVEAIFTVRSIADSKVHPTINQEEADPDCDLDYVPNVAREMDIRYALSNSLGFGGHNVTLAFGKYEGD